MRLINVYSCVVFVVMVALAIAWSVTINDAFLLAIFATGLVFFVIHPRLANRERARHQQIVDVLLYRTRR